MIAESREDDLLNGLNSSLSKIGTYWYNSPMTSAGQPAAWVANLEAETLRHLNGESSGHDPWHAFRVRDLGVRIARAIGADSVVVEAAALLHDIGHATGRVAHASRGANLAAEILVGCDFPADKISSVTACIEHHHWQLGRAGDPQCPTLEYQALADADRLDALGAIGVARTFSFGGAHRRPIWNPEPEQTAPAPYGRSSIHHFYDKLLRLPGDMYTEPGRLLAARRVVVMQEFLRTFYAEWKGMDVDAVANVGEQSLPSLASFPKRTVKVGNRIRRIFASILQPDPVN